MPRLVLRSTPIPCDRRITSFVDTCSLMLNEGHLHLVKLLVPTSPPYVTEGAYQYGQARLFLATTGKEVFFWAQTRLRQGEARNLPALDTYLKRLR